MAGNHRSGRRRKPTVLKIAAGNPGKRRLPSEPEFGDLVSVPSPERWIGENGISEWLRVTPELHESGVLKVTDLLILHGYCAMVHHAINVTRAIERDGYTIIDSDGQARKNPLLPAMTQLWDRVRVFSMELGLTPAARSRVVTGAVPGQASALLNFIQQRHDSNGSSDAGSSADDS